MLNTVLIVIAVILGVSCTSCFPMPPVASQEDIREKTERTYHSVVALYTEIRGDEASIFKSVCGGVMHDKYILTAAHCVGSPGGATHFSTFYDYVKDTGNMYEFVVVHQDVKQDAAVLTPSAVLKGRVESAPLGSSKGLIPGGRAATVGHPMGYLYSLSVGVISVPRRAREGAVYIQVDIDVTGGNSGGPLFDSEGKVLGIASALVQSRLHENYLAFFVPVEHYRKVLGKEEK